MIPALGIGSMSEAAVVDLDALQECANVFEAAYLWAERNDIPTWNGRAPLIFGLSCEECSLAAIR